MRYRGGTKANPVRCADPCEAFDVARELDRPVYCAIYESDEPDAMPAYYGTAFPSGMWKPGRRVKKIGKGGADA